MAEFVLKYADPQGTVHSQNIEAATEQEVRDRFTRQGFLVYSVRARGMALPGGSAKLGRKRLNIEKFLIFNQQFLTLVRAGLPILKALDLLAERLTDAKLMPYINAVRQKVQRFQNRQTRPNQR